MASNGMTQRLRAWMETTARRLAGTDEALEQLHQAREQMNRIEANVLAMADNLEVSEIERSEAEEEVRSGERPFDPHLGR